MRCDDVIRELAAPSGSVDQAAISDHLTRCGECAAWVERDAKLDRIWDVTRPEPPAPEAWESIWARATEAVDRELATEANSPVLRFRRRTVWIMAIAQVAAAAVAIVCLNPPHQDPGKASPIVVDSIEVDQGEVPVIHFDSQGRKGAVTDLALFENPANVGASLEFYNEIEGNADKWNMVQ